MMSSSNSSKLADCLHRIIAKNNEIICSLNSIITEVNKHQEKLNVVKTVGSSLGAVGALISIGGIIFAPVTAGASLSLTATALLPSLCGTTLVVEASVIDYFISKGFDEKIKKVAEQRNSIAKELEPIFKELNDLVVKLQNLGMSEEEAVWSTLTALTKGVIQLGVNGKTVFYNYKTANKVLKMYEIAKNLSNSGAVAKYSFGITSSWFTYGKTIADMTAVEAVGISKLAGSISKISGRTIGHIFNFSFVAYDIYDTFQGWKSSHPKIEDIKKLIEKLNSEITQFEVMLQLLNQKKN